MVGLKKFINIWHSSQDHLKKGDFRKDQEGRNCPLKTEASCSKWENWNIWCPHCTLLIVKTWFSTILATSLFKPANMRSPKFRNGVTWSYAEFQVLFICSFLYSATHRTYETIRTLILRQNDFPATWTFYLKYSYHS